MELTEETAPQAELSCPITPERVAELLRQGVDARPGCTRRWLLSELERAAGAGWDAALGAPLPEAAAALCAELEQRGDFTAGSGGRLYPTPLACIPISAQRYLVISSFPSRSLGALPGTLQSEGARRFLDSPRAHALQQALEAYGGEIIAPERWAGVTTSPVADEAWISELKDRLQGEANAAPKLSWRGLNPEASGPRFTGPDAAAQAGAQLWRAQAGHPAEGGPSWRYRFAEPGVQPDLQGSLKLSAEDFDRAVFAACRKAGAPVCAHAEGGQLSIQYRLPTPEYRYLRLFCGAPSGPGRWSLPEDPAPIFALLSARLGLHIQIGAKN